MKKYVFLLLVFIGFSCQKYSLHVTKLSLNQKSLASSFTKTNDPRLNSGLEGEELVIQWALSRENFCKVKGLVLDIIYKNFETEKVFYPIETKVGMQGFFVLGEKYNKTKGLLTYKAEIVDEDMVPITSWTQKMWFNLLKIQDFEKNVDELNIKGFQLLEDLGTDR